MRSECCGLTHRTVFNWMRRPLPLLANLHGGITESSHRVFFLILNSTAHLLSTFLATRFPSRLIMSSSFYGNSFHLSSCPAPYVRIHSAVGTFSHCLSAAQVVNSSTSRENEIPQLTIKCLVFSLILVESSQTMIIKAN